MADDAQQDQNILQRLITWRVGAAMEPQPPNETLLKVQQPFYDVLNKYYFRLEVDGWDRVPDETSLVVGVHSGGALTMDAWTLVNAWHVHFEGSATCGARRTTSSWPRPASATTSGPSASSPRTGRASARRSRRARTSSSGRVARSTRCAAGASATWPPSADGPVT
ncbi:hypothetical protein U6N30_20515 [Blastococcus brunescens]|uniref:Uncharacterized protein n=1 Tax=Blastococcus brunescens TaxID=1564165 RepID=A0ABZ1AV56_9ACTN|nr:hypothetical protein [Blastococcus sp. BMG 8361]WRL62390.1 hypothetical protein U6N30_20515 [Blastococcus sp. BMG 8361]